MAARNDEDVYSPIALDLTLISALANIPLLLQSLDDLKPQQRDDMVFKLIPLLICKSDPYSTTTIGQLLGKSENVLRMKYHCERDITLLHMVSMHDRVPLVELFLEHGADIDALDENERTPLYYACRNRCFNAAKVLLNRGAKVYTPTNLHRTALHWAADHGNLEVARMLLERGADPNDVVASTPFHLSFGCSYLELTQLFMCHGANVHLKNSAGENAIHLAVSAGILEIVEMLLADEGMNPNEATDCGMVPLHYAVLSRKCDSDRTLKVMELLLKYGAKVDVADGDGKTPLYVAVALAKRLEAKRLLDAGADVNGVSGWYRSGSTMPLFAALAIGDEGLTEMLLRRGASAEGKDNDGNGALHLAIREFMGVTLERDNLLEELIARGAQVNERNLKRKTPLHISITRLDDQLEQCRTLLDKGANPNLKDSSGNSAMGLAILLERPVEYLSLFLERGGNPNERAPTADHSLLYKALKVRDEEKVALLLDHGAECDEPTSLATYAAAHSSVLVMKLLIDRGIVRDINAKDPTGKTPIVAAVAYWQQMHMVRYLLEQNATVVDRVTGSAEAFVEAVDLYDRERSCAVSEKVVRLVLKNVVFNLITFKVPLRQEEVKLIRGRRNFTLMYQRYLNEIKIMNGTRVNGTHVTYLELFAKRHDALADCLRYEAVRNGLASNLHRKLFPSYGPALEVNCIAGIRRLRLIGTVQEMLHETLFKLVLPCEVTAMIAEVMSTKDLETSVVLAKKYREDSEYIL